MALDETRLIVSIDSRNAERDARNITRELQNLERGGNQASNSMGSLSAATRSLAGYMGGLLTVAAAVNKMDVYTGLQNRLKLVTNSQTELNTAMNDTFAIAQKTASSWDSAAMVYQRFADNAVRLNITMKETAALTETVAKAISVSGGSAASAEAALMQFGQALASGVLRGEEFNSIAEQAPGLLKAIAFGLDTNVGSLRAMAAAGKITGDVLVQSLTKAQPYIDDLFNKTDFTIAASFTKLSNEVTKFIGEAGKGSGAAAGLSDAISVLAENLGTIANIAVIGGVAMLTKAIATQTVAIHGSISAMVQRRALEIAGLQNNIRMAALEVQRTRTVAALAATEINLSRVEYNNASTRAARAAATVRLTQAEIAHRIALNQTTAATAAQTAAEGALTSARSFGVRALALVGGPIGAITIGVAALAAGYMYMSAKTAEATAKLAEQGRVADQTADDLKKLTGNDKKTAVTDLTSAFAAQNTELGKSKEAVDAVLFAIRASSVENEKARKVTEDAKAGTISYTQAVALLNKMDISPDLYVMLKKQALQYDENAGKASNTQRALSLLGVEVKLVGNNAQNAVVKIDSNTEAINKNETAADKAAKAQKNYADSLYDRYFDANFNKIILASGKTEGETKALLEAANYARKKGVEFTKEMSDEALRLYKLESSVQDVLDKRKEAEKKITQEKDKQAKLGEKQYSYSSAELKMLQKVAELSVKYDFDGVAAKHGLPKGLLGGVVAQESGGNNNAKSPTGAIGIGQTTSIYRKQHNMSVADSYNIPKVIDAMAKDIADAYKIFGNIEDAVTAYNAGVTGTKNLRKTGKTGSAAKTKEASSYADKVNKWSTKLGGSDLISKGAIGDESKTIADYEEFLKKIKQADKEVADNQKQLTLDVATYQERVRSELKDKLEEVDKAGFSPQETARLKAEYTARADNEIAISQYALKTKLSDYEAFTKDEAQLLRESFDEKKFYAARDIELSNEQKTQALVLLDRQLKQELELIKAAKQQRLFQAEQVMMSESDIIKTRYELELNEISKIMDVEEQRRMLAVAEYTKKTDQNALSGKLQTNYDQLRGVDTSAAEAMNERQLKIDELRENDFIKQQEYENLSLQSRMKYSADMLNLNLSYGEQIAGAASSMFGAMMGEQSAAYKVMFAAEKAFAIARSVMAIQTGIAQASSLPFPLNLSAMLTVAMQTASIVSNIKAVADNGFKAGGYTGNLGTSQQAGVVHGQEFVLNAAATKRVGVDTLNAVNSGKGDLGGGGAVVQPIINIHTLAGETAEVTTNEDGSIDVRIRKVVGDYMQAEFSNQNSKTSQSLKQNFNIAPKR